MPETMNAAHFDKILVVDDAIAEALTRARAGKRRKQ
jgi:hypothetical protein